MEDNKNINNDDEFIFIDVMDIEHNEPGEIPIPQPGAKNNLQPLLNDVNNVLQLPQPSAQQLKNSQSHNPTKSDSIPRVGSLNSMHSSNSQDDHDAQSLGGWSEISNVPSIRSFKSQTQSLHSSNKGNNNVYGNVDDDNKDDNDDNDDNDVEEGKIQDNMENINNNNNNIINQFEGIQKKKSVASSLTSNTSTRIPFSWAEITKIQPKFEHNNNNNNGNQNNKPKVFDSKNKLNVKNSVNNSNKKNVSKNKSENNDQFLPGIPETDPYATKNDIGRRKKNVKYPNGRRGSRRNPRNRNKS